MPADPGHDGAVAHLAFVPLEAFRPVRGVPNAAFPFWDFPDLPDYPLGGMASRNYAAIANGLDLLVTANTFTRDAFARAGVRTAIHVVPVPVRQTYVDVPLHDPRHRVVINCASYHPATPPERPHQTTRSKLKRLYHATVRNRLSRRWAETLSVGARSLAAVRREWRDAAGVTCPVRETLELSGVVYTTICNPFDQRKNWEDLLTAYLLALRDRDDATLVMKLVLPPDRADAGVNRVLRAYRKLGLSHRCRLVLVSAYLNDAQLLELARGTTYYINTSRAEGACLPLQDFLAAARPAIAPSHTALAELVGDDCAFVVESHAEPTAWPQDPDERCTTTWHRLVWTSLRDQIRESYRVATSEPERYRAMAAAARARMVSIASAEGVYARLSAALDSLLPDSGDAR